MTRGARYGFDDRTVAVLVAGRALSHEVTQYTVAMIEELGELAARHGAGAVVVPGTDLRHFEREGPAYCRVAIGLEVACADADAGRPAGPLAHGELDAALARAAERLDPLFWRRVAGVLERAPSQFTAAQQRASAASIGRAHFYEGMSLDAAELLAAGDALYLATAGPLPAGNVWYGRLHEPELDPEDPDAVWDLIEDSFPTDRIGFGAGIDGSQESHHVWVQGVHVAHANFAGFGVVPVSIDEAAHAERARITAPLGDGGYFVVPCYD